MISGKYEENQQAAQYVVVNNSSNQNLGQGRSAPISKRRSKLPYILVPIVLIFLVVGFVLLYRSDSSTPLASVVESSSYTIHYPKVMPKEFSYIDGSVTQDGGIITYRLASSEGDVVITQQQGPSESTELKIDGFSQSVTEIGSMLVGRTQGAPTVIIRAGGTLVTIKAPASASQSLVTKLANSLREVN